MEYAAGGTCRVEHAACGTCRVKYAACKTCRVEYAPCGTLYLVYQNYARQIETVRLGTKHKRELMIAIWRKSSSGKGFEMSSNTQLTNRDFRTPHTTLVINS